MPIDAWPLWPVINMKTTLLLLATALLLTPMVSAGTGDAAETSLQSAPNECDGLVDVFCIETECTHWYEGQCVWFDWQACYVWVNGLCVYIG